MSISSSEAKHDEEKAVDAVVNTDVVPVNAADDGVKRQGGVIGKMWSAVLWLDKWGVEARGIERVPESERNHTSIPDAGWFWLSANLQIVTFSLGTLGKEVFRLGLPDAVLVIVFFNLLTTLPVALFSSWGKSTGLRQMVITRFSFGRFALFPIVLNCLACIGWSAVNAIAGGTALAAASPTNPLPVPVGILIISALTLVVALFGYRHVHMFERYASLPIAVVFLVILGMAGSSFRNNGFGGSGPAELASVLSFGAAVGGFGLGWSSLASDYTVNFPVETPSWKVFAYTYAGLNLPLILIQSLGAAVAEAYPTARGLEEILRAPLASLGGFGSFLLVVLALSVVANNIPNMYSFALSFQAFGKFVQAVPRLFLVLLGTIIYTVVAIVGADSFERALSNFLLILAYWLAIFCVVLIEEHLIFRGGNFANYKLDSYNDLSVLPLGLGAFAATLFGATGAVMGMAEVLYTGPIGKLIGPPGGFGGDIGFELSFAFAGVTYPLFRYLEKKYIGR